MGAKKVLVATWGSPIGWDTVGYRVKLNNLKTEEKPIKSESTLKPVLETINPDKVILIVLDTLFNSVDGRNNPPKKGFEKGFDGKGTVSYEDVLQDVKNRIETYIKERLGLDYNDNNVRLFGLDKEGTEKNVIDLVVAPGAGAFPNVTVEGNVKDFHRYVLYALTNLLPLEDLSLYFDMTHGVNYMPVLTYRALGSLLRLLAYVRDVELTVVDSEPFKESGEQVLNIVPVENKTLEPAPIRGLIDGKDEWNAFISSLANGFPLVFLTFYPDVKKVEEFLNGKLKRFFNQIPVGHSGNGKYLIKREVRLDEGFKVASKLLYALRVLNLAGFKRVEEPTLNELRWVNDTLFRKIPRINHVTGTQLDELGKKLRSKPRSENKWCILGSIEEFEYQDEALVRNFIAHSGFEYNITLVKKSGKKYQFKYSKDNRRAVIKLAIEAMNPNSRTKKIKIPKKSGSEC